MSRTPNTLTKTQRDMLAVLAARPGLNYTGRDLLAALPENHLTTQGVHQTAASLVRRGLAYHGKDIDGRVCYRATPDGWWVVRGPNPDEPTFADEWGTA
jgi:hypothetical protein